jgi:S1-C subfamily serine protease
VTLGEFTAEALTRANADAALRSLASYGLSFPFRRRGVPLDDPAVVRRVAPDSPAAEAGFKTGQTVLQVGDQSVKSIGDLCSAVVQQGLLIGKSIPIVVAEDQGEVSPAPKTIIVRILR